MKRTRLRSGLIFLALSAVAALAWVYLAPTQIGGSTTYVVTSGTSMGPRFHSGDLALVRPASHYELGQIVAYRSSLLHVVVLHRIIGMRAGRYTFKGDNNGFVDPGHPTRSALIGALWLRVPHGGRLLRWLHRPLTAAAVCALVGFMLLGAGETRRRRRKRRRSADGSGLRGASQVSPHKLPGIAALNLRSLLIGSLASAAAFFALGFFAFTLRERRPSVVRIPYEQGVSFGYHATARPGAVYPDGRIRTGDPIFVQLVRQVHVTIDYHFSAGTAHHVAGAMQILLRLTGPSGWKRRFALAPPQRFIGDHAAGAVTLDLAQLHSLLQRFQVLTGLPADAGYSVDVVPQVRLSGSVGSTALKTTFAPALSFQLQPLQLEPSAGAGSSTSGGLAPSQRATISTRGSAPNRFTIAGASIQVETLRLIALVGLLLAGGCAIAARALQKLRDPLGEVARIHARYGDLIVPVRTEAAALDLMPFDVQSIEDLVRLARSGERLILHHRDGFTDTYLVNDDVSVYRYRVDVPVMWGEWLPPRQTQVDEPGKTDAAPGSEARSAISTDGRPRQVS